ncbi:KH domain-containing protein HEN4-like isoform X2 [Pistacia vera]|uniref:KH domain-containing protein HEN4-like isoform X2 n=1 Tax=Pistacia vera TaxID=55513 RepID=UPI001262F49F|nr:KH domain-containing protein HEN4-like isoform X2 [Pistacia vera]
MESGPTEFRLVCSAAVGKSESTISHLESQTGAKIRVLDDPSCEDCIIVVTLDPATNKDHYNVNREGEDESWTPEQRSLVRVYERIVKGEAGEKDEQVEDLTCRMIIGRGLGKVVEKIESESGGGAQVRVLAKDQIPGSGAGSDELIQITGSFPAVKKALLSVSSCVQDSPRVDVANTNVTKPPGMLHHGNPMLASVEPFHQRGYGPGFHSRGYSSGPGPETVGAHNRIYFEEDVVFKLLCHLDKVGSLIGKGGSIVRTFQNETGASIKIADVVPDSDERVVLISARENSEQRHSPAQDAVMRVHSRIAEIGFEPGNAVVARLLVHSQQIGCLLGRGGYIISEMRRATGASIRVFPREQAPKCGSPNDEVVQVIGNFHSVQDALFHITSRLRETIFPMKPHFPNNGPPYLPPFPEMPPPPFRPRHNPASPGSYPSPVGPFHGIDRSQPIDRQPSFSHGMDHMGPPNFDRVPYPYGGERPGHGHIFDRPPSPRSWGPQAGSGGNHRGVDVASGYTARNGSLAGGNHAPILTSTTVEVVIPQAFMAHVYGENNSNLGHIRQVQM